jgi:DNA-binding response OmpR family regulator
MSQLEQSSQSSSSQGTSSELVEDRRILVIEDEQDIRSLVELHLRDTYRVVATADNGTTGFELASSEPWDLIILDLRLPGMDGLELCRKLRANSVYIPVLMLTSKSSELDRVLGLEMGADDYVTKPFSIIELMARVKAILRRVSALSKQQTPVNVNPIEQGRLALDVDKRTVALDGHSVELTAKEFDLLLHFVKAPGKVFTRADLLDAVWGYGHQGYEHTVNSHINRLRSKLHIPSVTQPCIVTVWGVGYKLNDEF